MARFALMPGAARGGDPAVEVEAVRIDSWRGTRWRVSARDPDRRGEMPDHAFRRLFVPIDPEAEDLLIGPRD